MQSNEELKTELKNLLDTGDILRSIERVSKSRFSEAIALCSKLTGESAYDRDKLSRASLFLSDDKKELDPDSRANLVTEALYNIDHHAK
tara:strand:- start:707 stop:973 length:267 start_codon:yes stop_codon:yes gene_type:complete